MEIWISLAAFSKLPQIFQQFAAATILRPFLILCVVSVLAACQTAKPPRHEVERRLAAAFDDLVFQPIPQMFDLSKPSGPHKVEKWDQPIYFAVFPDFGNQEPFRSVFETWTNEVSFLTGINIERAAPGSKTANVVFIFADVDSFKFDHGLKAAGCIASNVDDNFELFKKEIPELAAGFEKLDTDSVISSKPKHLVFLPGHDLSMAGSCLLHEILHVMGFPGHTFRLYSVMGITEDDTELNKWDRILLKTLYSRRLRRGMSRDAAMPMVREIVSILLAKNE